MRQENLQIECLFSDFFMLHGTLLGTLWYTIDQSRSIFSVHNRLPRPPDAGEPRANAGTHGAGAGAGTCWAAAEAGTFVAEEDAGK